MSAFVFLFLLIRVHLDTILFLLFIASSSRLLYRRMRKRIFRVEESKGFMCYDLEAYQNESQQRRRYDLFRKDIATSWRNTINTSRAVWMYVSLFSLK
jgi:hypothetical protein